MSTFPCSANIARAYECGLFKAHNNPLLKRIILNGEITRISHGAKTIMTTQGQIIQTTSNIPIIITIIPIINLTFQIIITIFSIINPIFPIINKTFPTKLHNLLSKIPLQIRK